MLSRWLHGDQSQQAALEKISHQEVAEQLLARSLTTQNKSLRKKPQKKSLSRWYFSHRCGAIWFIVDESPLLSDPVRSRSCWAGLSRAAGSVYHVTATTLDSTSGAVLVRIQRPALSDRALRSTTVVRFTAEEGLRPSSPSQAPGRGGFKPRCQPASTQFLTPAYSRSAV